jgi:hypothetical protein
MNGDYTKVPLRAADRWTGARMQQGRVLLDHEWNLNLDATARRAQREALDAIGRYGVPRYTGGFAVSFDPASATPKLMIGAGHMWVGGLVAVAPAPFDYASQVGITALPASGKVLVYLDTFLEHVQPAEAPDELVEPALAPVDSSARTRVGYRVRAAATTFGTPRAAWATTSVVGGSTGAITLARIAQAASTNGCAPPGDPLAMLPDGLLRVEVLDKGDEKTARFAWSFENGSTAAPVTAVTGKKVTVAGWPGVEFHIHDVVELSWLARRADRIAHGPLYEIKQADPVAGGFELTLDRTVSPPAGSPKLVLRRWDGSFTGPGAHKLAYRGQDYATVTFEAGTYEVGDWWGFAVREGANGVEERTKAPPDGGAHAFAPLALVDLTTRAVEDARPKFNALLDTGNGSCTVTAYPGDDLQDIVDSLPLGGEICFQTGEYTLPAPLKLTQHDRIVLHGAGPSTVLRIAGSEAAVVFEDCVDVEVRELRIEGGAPAQATGHRDGALTFLGCSDVVVADCTLGCRDNTDASASDPTRACLTVRPSANRNPDRVRVERTDFEIGSKQIGALLIDVDDIRVAANRMRLGPPPGASSPNRFALQGIVVAGTKAPTVQIVDNVVSDVAQGIKVALSDSTGKKLRAGDVQIRGNFIHVLIPRDYAKERQAIYLGNVNCGHIANTAAELARLPGVTPASPVDAIRVESPEGPFLSVRDTCCDGFNVGVVVVTPASIPKDHMWLVDGTMAANGKLAVDAEDPIVTVTDNNAPVPPAAALDKVVDVPTNMASGQVVAARVVLDNPAPRGGATVALSSTNAAAATLSGGSVKIPAGQTTGSFTITGAAAAGKIEKTEIKATYKGVDKLSGQLQVTGSPAVKSIALSATSAVGGAGATVTGTVTMSSAVAQGTQITLTSSDQSKVAVPSSIGVDASGLSATFTAQVKLNTGAQPVPVTVSANQGGVTVSTVLTVLAAPLLKVGRLRLLKVVRGQETGNPTSVKFDSNNAGTAFLTSRTLKYTDQATKPNAVELTFSQAAVNQSTVVNGQTFSVSHDVQALSQPANQQLYWIDASTVRWVADSLPMREPDDDEYGAIDTDYTASISGVKSDKGRTLDGDITQSGFGDGVEGGAFHFTIVLEKFVSDPDWDTANPHIYDPDDGTYVP